MAVRNKDIPLLVECDVGRPVELVPLDASADRTGRGGRRTTTDPIEARHRQVFRCASENHLHLSLLVELDDRARPLVDRPDVVLRIDANRVGEDESVKTLAELAQILARLVELEETGPAGAAMKMALGSQRQLW